jgi:uncharacterized delta-60 repeat protein
MIALALLFGSHPLVAATRTWTGGTPGDPTCSQFTNINLWSIPCNWSGKTAPAGGDDLVFPGSIQTTSVNNFASGTTFNSLNISGGHVMGGAAITLNNGLTAVGAIIQLASIKLNLDQAFIVPNSTDGALINSPIDTNGKLLTIAGVGTATVTGVISGSGSVKRSNLGTALLTGNNTYTGATVVTGEMLVFGSQPQSPVTVTGTDDSEAVLGGGGTVGSVSVGNRRSVIAPGAGGNTTGILKVNGDVTFAPNASISRLRIDLNGTVAGSGYDRLRTTGTINLGSSNSLTLAIGGGFVPAGGETFLIIDNAGPNPVAGTFSGRSEGTLFTVGGTTFRISYVGGDGNDVTLTVFSGTVAFTSSVFAVNEGNSAAITLSRVGGGNTTAVASLTLDDVSTTPADYVFAPGKLDPSFDAGPGLNGRVSAAVTQPDGKTIIGGEFTAVTGFVRGRLARLNANGSVDTSFDSGFGADLAVRGIALQPDGKVVIVGDFFEYGGTTRKHVARLNSNGTLDPTFDPAAGPDGNASSIVLQLDGKMIIGGNFANYNGVARRGVVRVNSDGSLDTSFVPNLGQSALSVLDVTIDRDGKVLVGGDVFNGGNVVRLVRLNPNGSSDASFTPGTLDGTLFAVAAQPDGKIMIGGRFATVNGVPRRHVARLASDGTVDTAFDPGVGPDLNVRQIAVQADGKPIIAGDFLNYNNVPRGNIARLQLNGTLDPSFDPGTGADEQVDALFLQADGKILIGGNIDQYDGVVRSRLARIRGDLVATWAPNDFADKTILLPIADDNLFEGNEKLNLQIVPLSGAVSGPPSTAELTIVDNDVSAPAKALNISTRLRAETGDNVMIAGFIITGDASKSVVLRGMGPVLGSFGINDFLADPVVDLRGPGGPIVINNNWKDTQRAQIEGTVFQPGDDRESVIMATLPPASYTAILTGNNNTTGVGLIEVYDNNSAADSQLANISTRGLVQGSNSVMIGGFILGGNSGSSRIAVRGIGPSLAQVGLSNVLTNPTLELHDGNGATLIANDDWETDSASAGQLSANGLAPSSPKEAGIFASLPAGVFTAILAGKDGGSGIGLIEIFNLQ